jgi:hypothetical protein
MKATMPDNSKHLLLLLRQYTLIDIDRDSDRAMPQQFGHRFQIGLPSKKHCRRTQPFQVKLSTSSPQKAWTTEFQHLQALKLPKVLQEAPLLTCLELKSKFFQAY